MERTEVRPDTERGDSARAGSSCDRLSRPLQAHRQFFGGAPYPLLGSSEDARHETLPLMAARTQFVEQFRLPGKVHGRARPPRPRPGAATRLSGSDSMSGAIPARRRCVGGFAVRTAARRDTRWQAGERDTRPRGKARVIARARRGTRMIMARGRAVHTALPEAASHRGARAPCTGLSVANSCECVAPIYQPSCSRVDAKIAERAVTPAGSGVCVALVQSGREDLNLRPPAPEGGESARIKPRHVDLVCRLRSRICRVCSSFADSVFGLHEEALSEEPAPAPTCAACKQLLAFMQVLAYNPRP